ncbi:MAG: hypothetical protein HPY59_08950 [Anaerolineae bacterium]|nr:hypothetical protein [Anaerolineae bacterium]
MKNKSSAFLILAYSAVFGGFLIVSWLKGVGSDLFRAIASTSGEQPVVLMESIPPATSYRPLSVDSVAVETGPGSPPLVQAIISGSLPDTCAQVEFVEQVQTGAAFVIRLAAIPSAAADCIQHPIPFTINLPLNAAGLPAGSYAVEANGVRAAFDLAAGDLARELPTGDVPVVKDDLQVKDVEVEIGVDSSIPVKELIAGNLPSACAWLGEIRLRREERTFFVRLVAHQPAQLDCPENGLPFHLELPLNIASLSPGSYTVDVNGVAAGFDLSLRSPSP